MVLQSSKTLADLTEQRVIPADYLYCLIALFLCLVLDRVFYTTGQHLGKVPLLPILYIILLTRSDLSSPGFPVLHPFKG